MMPVKLAKCTFTGITHIFFKDQIMLERETKNVFETYLHISMGLVCLVDTDFQ